MRAIITSPEVKQAVIKTSGNLLRLGAVAGVSVFVNSVFRSLATATIQRVQIDYENIRAIVANR